MAALRIQIHPLTHKKTTHIPSISCSIQQPSQNNIKVNKFIIILNTIFIIYVIVSFAFDTFGLFAP